MPSHSKHTKLPQQPQEEQVFARRPHAPHNFKLWGSISLNGNGFAVARTTNKWHWGYPSAHSFAHSCGYSHPVTSTHSLPRTSSFFFLFCLSQPLQLRGSNRAGLRHSACRLRVAIRNEQRQLDYVAAKNACGFVANNKKWRRHEQRQPRAQTFISNSLDVDKLACELWIHFRKCTSEFSLTAWHDDGSGSASAAFQGPLPRFCNPPPALLQIDLICL